MKIAIVADSHFEQSSRWEDCIEIHSWISTDIRERGVDVLLHAGDVFDRKSNPVERLSVASWIKSVADYCPVVIVRGNHDVVDDLAIFGRLKSKYRILVEQRYGVHLIDTPKGGVVAVQALAWPRKAEVLAHSRGLSTETNTDAVGALRDILHGMAAGSEGILEGMSILSPGDTKRIPRVLLTHAMVRGAVSSGVGQPLVGCEMELGLDDLALARSDFAALGHIHARQDWTYDGTPMVYPGSPRRTAFGEMEPKGYVIAEFEGRKLVRWYRVETPARPMLHVQWTGDQLPADDEIDADGAEIRLRYDVGASTTERMEAKARAKQLSERLLEQGAAVVKIEERVSADVRARAPEVSESKTVPEKLRAFWKVRNEVPDEQTQEELLAKLFEIEQEAMKELASAVREVE